MKKTILTSVTLLIMVLAMSTSLMADGIEPTGNPRQVSTLDHLLWISTNGSSWGDDFEQTADIDASTTSGWNGVAGFSIIHNFTGSYNGYGHTINGLYINSGTSWSECGLFGHTFGATIRNLGLTNVNISGGGCVGGLVGNTDNSSTVANCYSTGSVNGTLDRVGGLVGFNDDNSIVTDCYSTGSVTGDESVGGLVGYNYYSTVTDCYSTGSVNGGTGGEVGGLVGVNFNSSVTDCYSTGSVTGTGSSGGVDWLGIILIAQ